MRFLAIGEVDRELLVEALTDLRAKIEREERTADAIGLQSGVRTLQLEALRGGPRLGEGLIARVQQDPRLAAEFERATDRAAVQ